MKRLLVGLALLACVGTTLAIDRIPPEEAKRIAKLLAETAANADNLPAKVEVDAEKPSGIRANEVGLMIIPARDLSEATLEKAGKDVTPIGHLWMRSVVPQRDGRVLTNDEIRILKVQTDNNELLLPFFIVGVRKGDKGLELVLLGKDQKPVIVAPLKKAEVNAEMPIDLEGKRGDGEQTGVLTINILGKYQTTVTVGHQQS
jgi:hypothetical protein